MKRRASLKWRALPRLLGFQIDRVQIQTAAEDNVAAGNDNGPGAAFAFFVFLIERRDAWRG